METEKLKYLANLRHETSEYINSVIAKLENLRQVDDADFGMLRILAENYNTFLCASDELNASTLTIINTSGNVVRNPIIDIKQKAENACIAISRELLATPKSRKTIDKPVDVESSPLDDFFDD